MNHIIYRINNILTRKCSNIVKSAVSSCENTSKINQNSSLSAAHEYTEFKNDWPSLEKQNFIRDMTVIENFITPDEEDHFLKELEPYLKRMRYEYDHWDDAIHGFRETERKNWYPNNKAVIQRIRDIAFNGETLPHVHVLDLAENGVIKPHVDSTRYCGTTIAGVSLLSDSVMKLVRTDEKKYQQNQSDGDYRAQPPVEEKTSDENAFSANILLKRYSLYIMRDTARYNFTHEILAQGASVFKDRNISRKRRISIICRNEP